MDGDETYGIVGVSAAVRHLRATVHKVAQSRLPVLLQGETGTGKEVVARAIHEANPLGPFVTIDCGAMVGTLMESELFGHVRGAFTGATEAKRGLVEMAAGGTAFFDEIGDLAPEMQVKLLRLLQEGTFRAVGSTRTQKVEIRVIAATLRDLAEEVRDGRFRQDLYYRLNVIKVRIAPLRSRRDDILPLARFFLDAMGCEHEMTSAVEQALLSYDWPGNVRELKNCIERMVALNSGPQLSLLDLPSAVMTHLAARQEAPEPSPAYDEVLPDVFVHSHAVKVSDAERREILKALRETGGDRSKAATLLGIGRTTLYRKLKRYSIEE